MENVNEKIIVALDFADPDKVEALIHSLDGQLKFVKVGMELFYTCGPQIIDFLKSKKLKIFLDLKLHDIPTTVQKAIRQVATLDVDIINVHAAGGIAMMKAALEGLHEGAFPGKLPRLIAVTQLTSTSKDIMNNEIMISGEVDQIVVKYAQNAKFSGLDGVVASPQEVKLIKKNCGKDFITVTPGVRPTWDQSNDHKRMCTPSEAFKNGTDYIVIGRTITNASNPMENFQKIISEIKG